MKTWSCFFSLYHILWRALCYWYKTRNLAVGKRHRLMKRRARCVWRNRHLKKSTPPQYSTIFFFFVSSFLLSPFFLLYLNTAPRSHCCLSFINCAGLVRSSFVLFFFGKIGCCFICLPPVSVSSFKIRKPEFSF